MYGSNRGHNTIAVFSIGPQGTLTLLDNVDTQGLIPRNFGIDPTGSFLLALNQSSNNVVVFPNRQENRPAFAYRSDRRGSRTDVREVPAPQVTTEISDLASKKVMYRMRILLFVAFQAVLTMAWGQSPDGRSTFQSLCSGCHGTDGNGGEHAPSILAQPRPTKNDEGINPLHRP